MSNEQSIIATKVDRKIIFHSIKGTAIAMPGDYIYVDKQGNMNVLKSYIDGKGNKDE